MSENALDSIGASRLGIKTRQPMETIFRDLNRWLEKSCPGVADALR